MINKSADHHANARSRSQQALDQLARWFGQQGWKVEHSPHPSQRQAPDMVIRRGDASFAVELKVAAEGRSDRLIPLWSQAWLQAQSSAQAEYSPLAIVAAPRIPASSADAIMRFIAEVAPNAAGGVIDLAGLRRFHGIPMDPDESDGDSAALDRELARHGRAAEGRSAHHAPVDLFSDLNQWMLKVLLAPEIPERLLSAPRERYRSAAKLAQSARVSVMSASRLIRELQRLGYLDESSPFFRLVRRDELFRRWQAALDRRVRERPMRFLLRGEPRAELQKMMRRGRASLALFSAADALDLGFVHGVPAYVYVPRLDGETLAVWKNLVPAKPGEVANVIVRQAPAAQAVFRGAVRAHDQLVSDVLQVWLDVSSHPSRGQEQADFIKRRVLGPVLELADAHG